MFEIEAIILRESPFKDNDMMVTALSNENIHSFLAKGVMKIDSKNKVLVTKFNKVRLELSKGKEGYNLRTGTLLNSYMHAKEGLTSLAILDFISEITNKIVSKDEASVIYPILDKVLSLLDKGFDGLTLALIYFAKVLTIAGYGLNVDSCQICHQKEAITALSTMDGGFICENCFDASIHLKLNANELKILRYIFKVDIDNFAKAVLPKEESLHVLNILEQFALDTVDLSLKSIAFIRRIIK